ncbi:MAG: hypothetical protein JWO02_1134 [Solirubrobacterales bacterium]|nr:hypothetical protein [Solirubrobacterales bacterium]
MSSPESPEPRSPASRPSFTLPSLRRRSALILAAIAVLVVAAAAVALSGGSTSTPPAAEATRLVPADALVYLHLSTDTGRDGTAAAKQLAERFPGFEPARRSLVRRLSAPGCQVDAAALNGGREAALALVDVGQGNAGSLVYVDTGNTAKVPERTCGTIQTAKFGRFLVIGQPQTIVIARQLAAGKGKPLSGDPDYRRELARLPAGRVADAWVSKAGVQRLLAPQGGLLGAAGILLDQPGLKATAAALTSSKGGARLVLRSLRDPKAVKAAAGSSKLFTPSIQDEVPDRAFAFLGLTGLSGAAGRLLGLAGPQTAQLAPLLARAGKDLNPLLGLFSGEVAVTITADTPTPILTLITKTKNPGAARATLARAQQPVARLLAPSSGAVPAWRAVGGGFQLRPTAGVELDYAVVGDLVVVSTRAAGIAAVRDRKATLPQTDAWRVSMGNTQKPVSSLVFLDFNQLLRLGEQTGLNDSKQYLAVKDDLQRLKSVSARSSSDGDESTVELFLSLP